MHFLTGSSGCLQQVDAIAAWSWLLCVLYFTSGGLHVKRRESRPSTGLARR